MTDSFASFTTAIASRYRIERELGQGGMATVYLAHDVKHGRNVALKVLRDDVTHTVGADRFLREIQLAARLNHPNIIALFDSGEIDGVLFYVMPAVDGQSLRELLDVQIQLPVADAVRIVSEVASALEHAHCHGVVHRDIKPENILLHGGHALVADFGIGKALSDVDGAGFTQALDQLGRELIGHAALDDDALGRRVDRGRVVAALARPDDRLTLRAAGQVGQHAGDVVARRAAEVEPLVHPRGNSRRPDVSLG